MKIREIIKTNMGEMADHKTAAIAFLGDSVTQGCFELYKAQKGNLETEFYNGEGYHSKLKKIFDHIFPRASVNTINAGISGDNAPNGAKRVAEDVIKFSPQLAVVAYGLNDSGGGEEGIERYTDALRSIFRQLKAADIEVVFMTTNMKATYETNELKGLEIEEIIVGNVKSQTSGVMDMYMEAAKKVCTEEGVAVCDCYAKWKKLEENGADITRLLSNRINHPTEEMHWLFAWSLFETIMGF